MMPRHRAAARFATLALAAALALAACKDRAEPPPPAPAPSLAMPANEVKRGQDACNAYVEKVCACAKTVPALEQQCTLARALPDALQVGTEVAATPDTKRRDALQANQSARGIVKECVEQLAKLPVAGCP
jgi:hypothetical protein